MKERKRTAKRLVSLFVCLCMIVTLAPQGAFAAPSENKTTSEKSMKTLGYQVSGKTTTTLNVRKGPSSKSSKVGRLNEGAAIKIKGFEKTNSDVWYEISYKNKKAYVHSAYVNVYKNTYKSHKRGKTLSNVSAYIPTEKSKVKVRYTIPKGEMYRPINRIYTNKGYIYRVQYKGKIAYIRNKNINRDPVLNTFEFPTGLKVTLDKSLELYRTSASGGEVATRAPKGTKLVFTALRERYYDKWYITSYKGKRHYCKIDEIDVYATHYKEGRQGKTTGEVIACQEQNNKVVSEFKIPKGKFFKLIGRIYTEEGSVYRISYNGNEGFIRYKNIELDPVMKTVLYSSKIKRTLRGYVSLYNGTTSKADFVLKAQKGDSIDVLEKIYRDTQSWYKVLFEGKILYCKTGSLSLRDVSYEKTRRFAEKSFNIYEEPTEGSHLVKDIPSKRIIDLIGRIKTEDGDYLEIKYNGERGYAKASRVEKYIKEEYVIDSLKYSSLINGKTVKSATLYKGMSTNSLKMGTVGASVKVKVVSYIKKNTGTWYEIRHNGEDVYISEDAINLVDKKYSTIVGGLTTTSLNFRDGIGTNSKVIGTIPKKGFVTAKERYSTESGRWYKVLYAGKTGYVSGKYLDFNEIGIDVSKFNTKIDWNRVARSGIDFVYVRAGHTWGGSGKMQEDPYFKSHIEGAISAGLKVGVYYYTQAINKTEAKDEADFVCKLIEPYEGKVTLPIVIDTEYVPGRTGRADYLSKRARTDIIKRFCERVQWRGYEPMMYMSKAWITGNLYYDDLKEFPLWVAQYNNYNTTSQEHDYWQYTSSGYVPGVTGRVDMNIKMK